MTHVHRFIHPVNADGTPVFNDPICERCGNHPEGPAPFVVVQFSADATPEEVETARDQIESLMTIDPDRLARVLTSKAASAWIGLMVRNQGGTWGKKVRVAPGFAHDFALALARAYAEDKS